MNEEEAQRAYDEAEHVPISEQRINEIVAYATFEHPTDPATGRFLCSPEHPMPKDAPNGTRWVHTNVAEVGEQEDGYPGGNLQRMRCKDCGVNWKMELPQ